MTGLTRTTVSDLVSELLETGLIEESGHGPSGGGKSPILLRVVSDARHVIAIDLAATAFRGAVVNLRGEVKHTIVLAWKALAASKQSLWFMSWSMR